MNYDRFIFFYQITPTQFIEMINIVNESMISAHSLRWSCLDNAIAVFTLYLSRLLVRSHYERVSYLLTPDLLLASNDDVNSGYEIGNGSVEVPDRRT